MDTKLKKEELDYLQNDIVTTQQIFVVTMGHMILSRIRKTLKDFPYTNSQRTLESQSYLKGEFNDD